LRPQIEAIVDRMLETMRQVSEADVVREIAYPLPVRVMAEMFGVPETMHERFTRWTHAIGMFLGNPNRTVEQTHVAHSINSGEREDHFGPRIPVRRTPLDWCLAAGSRATPLARTSAVFQIRC
jgi:cytochrome P450